MEEAVTWIRLKAFIANAWTAYKLYIVVGAALLLCGLLWLYGAKAWNHVGSWWYGRGTQAAHEEIEGAKNEAQEAKQVAQDALNKLAAEKQITAEERRKRELAEKILADKSKTTDQKLKAYEDAVNRAPTVTGGQSTDELCERARALNIRCE